MTAFQFFAGLTLFGLLWLIIPRTSFVVALGVLLEMQFDFSVGGLFEVFTMTLLIIGGIAGIILDIVEHNSALQ